MKIYTKTGDNGTTSLLGGTRVPKHHLRIESYGTLDELNSWIGLIRDQPIDQSFKNLLTKIQGNLFTVGAFLAVDPKKKTLKNGSKPLSIPNINDIDVVILEQEIDKMEANLPPMTHFILPGGHTTVSYCHITRTICRRTERLISQLNALEPVAPILLKYLNRLSDFLFVLARKLNHDLGVTEIKWNSEEQDE